MEVVLSAPHSSDLDPLADASAQAHSPATFLVMGAYLSAPVTDKESEDGKSSRVRYGVSAMQVSLCHVKGSLGSMPRRHQRNLLNRRGGAAPWRMPTWHSPT
jgi:hypothetical protein